MHKPMFIMGFPELEAEAKWKLLGGHALAVWRFDLAWESSKKSQQSQCVDVAFVVDGSYGWAAEACC